MREVADQMKHIAVRFAPRGLSRFLVSFIALARLVEATRARVCHQLISVVPAYRNLPAGIISRTGGIILVYHQRAKNLTQPVISRTACASSRAGDDKVIARSCRRNV